MRKAIPPADFLASSLSLTRARIAKARLNVVMTARRNEFVLSFSIKVTI
jgi:hypothetical protein